MDRKSIAVIAICFALIVGWSFMIKRLYPQPPAQPRATNVVAEAQIAPPATTPPSIGPVTTPKLVVPAGVAEETIVLTNDDSRYTFTSRGGGLQSVELLHYPETVSRKDKSGPLTNGLASLNDHAPAPVLAILGDAAVQGDGVYSISKNGENGVRAEMTLTNGLRVIKEFQIGSNYLFSAKVRLENTALTPLTLPGQEWVIGTATPMAIDDKGQTEGLLWYDGDKKTDIGPMWFENKTLGCFKGVPRTEYQAGSSNIVWASVHNQFFTLIAMPKKPAREIVARPIELPRPPEAEIPLNLRNAPPQKGFQASFVIPSQSLAPGQTVEEEFNFYAGPKEYRTLARIAERFQNNVDLVMGFGGFFGFFSKALLLGMNWLHNVFKLPYGWAIIAITIILKTLFWPLTAASTRSMKRMAALQPQMKVLQEKYKEDPAKLNKKMMEMWKEHKVSPVGGCLPMMIQMPVFIGFFYMIRSAIELRGASWLWVANLSKPDTLFIIPGFDFPFNLLPLIMGATMLWQSHQTPPSPGMDPMQQKLMRYMPLMFLVMLYNFPAGLALYWTVNNLLTILQTKLTKARDPVTAAAVSPLTPALKKKK
jgi:YidC/Oxa1 family membrane protein insertase